MSRPQHGPHFHGAVFRVLPSDPTPGVVGDAYLHSGTKHVRYYDGTAWQSLALGSVATYAAAGHASGTGTANDGNPTP